MRKLLSLLILVSLLSLSVLPAAAQTTSSKSIAQIASGDSRFTTLVAALKAADLVDTLNSPGDYTVFAPTNDAFAALPSGTIPALLADKAALTKVLLYHVAAGRVPASTVVTLDHATTLEGSDVLIRVTADGVMLNGSVKVIITDIQASNGIIHVIDGVLLPPRTDINDLVVFTRDAPIFAAPGGDDTGNKLLQCQTAFVDEQIQNFGHIEIMGGWVDLGNTQVVPADYNQVNGTPVLGGCEGR